MRYRPLLPAMFGVAVTASGAGAPPEGPPPAPSVANCFAQGFDNVTPPALPFGWVAYNALGPPPEWVTSASTPDVGPNDAFVDTPAAASDRRLESPPIPVTTYPGSVLTFRHMYEFAQNTDGGVLEISANGGAFSDISGISGGTTGGYDGLIASAGNPLNGRQAWTGSSGGGYRTTSVILKYISGQTVVLRWRMGSSGTGGGGFWRIDSISVTEPCVLPAGLELDRHATTSLAASSDLNGILEPDETVVVEPAHANLDEGNVIVAGTAPAIAGPPGATYSILDGAADYGTLVEGSVGDCYGASGNCYLIFVGNAATRPSPHWDVALTESLDAGVYHLWPLHVGDSFGDVPPSHQFYPFVENLFHHQITGGCASGTYCVAAGTLRQQMAVFLLKARYGWSYLPPPCAGVFQDVTCPGAFADWIEDLYARGIATGCGAGFYCPGNPVTRQQMAVFLLKALKGSTYSPPPCAGIFSDVPCANSFAPWVEDLYNRQIAAGCGAGKYCPTNPTTRGQMAPFLVKTFGLLLYGP